MGNFSDYLEDELLDHILNASYTPAATLYLGLGTAADDTGLTEFSGDGYAREVIAFDAAASRAVAQSSDIEFGPVSGNSWVNGSNYGVFDALSGGNMLLWGTFDSIKTAAVGRSPKVVAGEVVISFNAGKVSDVWAHKLLNRVFRNITLGTDTPTTYVAQVETNVVDSDTDITAKEPGDAAYVRELVNINGGLAPTWDLVLGGASSNGEQIDYTPPSVSAWAVVGMAICDAETTGQVILWVDTADETVGVGDPVNYPVGALDITLD